MSRRQYFLWRKYLMLVFEIDYRFCSMQLIRWKILDRSDVAPLRESCTFLDTYNNLSLKKHSLSYQLTNLIDQCLPLIVTILTLSNMEDLAEVNFSNPSVVQFCRIKNHNFTTRKLQKKRSMVKSSKVKQKLRYVDIKF